MRGDEPDDRSRRLALLAAQFLGVGFTFLAELGCFTALGWWCDGKWGTRPWLMLLGAVIGMTVALYHLLRSASSYEAAVKATKEPKDPTRDEHD